MARRNRRSPLTSAAARAALRFPEPFFWTTDRLRAIEDAVPNFGTHPLDARPLAAFDPGVGSIDFVVEGDSWFNHPFLLDVLDWFNADGLTFAGSFVPGRTLETMIQKKRYLDPLQHFEVRAVLLSGGGNDLIQWRKPAGGASRIFRPAPGSTHPRDFFDETELAAAMMHLGALLRQFAKDVRSVTPGARIVTHFYDWIEPRDYDVPFSSGEWVNPQLDIIGAPKDQALRTAIARYLIDFANDRHAEACQANGVTYVNLRDTVRRRWYDEIHPKNAAFREIATKLVAGIPVLAARLAAAAMPADGAPARRAATRRPTSKRRPRRRPRAARRRTGR